jgi:anti-sigma factor RsiW
MITYMHTTNHLSDELLNSWVDGVVTTDERSIICTHLEHCQLCRDELESLRTVKRLLSDLPQVRLPRSFQLTPEQGRNRDTGTESATYASESENPAHVPGSLDEVVDEGQAIPGSEVAVTGKALAFPGVSPRMLAAMAFGLAVSLAGLRVALHRAGRLRPAP